MKLRCPGHPLLAFNGDSSALSAGGVTDDTNSVDNDNAGPDSEAWRKALSREIAKLRRELGTGTQRGSSGAGGAMSWRWWNVVSGAVGGEGAVAESVLNGVRGW